MVDLPLLGDDLVPEADSGGGPGGWGGGLDITLSICNINIRADSAESRVLCNGLTNAD